MDQFNIEIQNPDSLTIVWTEAKKFTGYAEFVWRGLPILVKAKQSVHMATNLEINIYENSNKTRIGVARHYAGGGRYGQKPQISMDNFFLSISYGFDEITFKDQKTEEVPKRKKPNPTEVFSLPKKTNFQYEIFGPPVVKPTTTKIVGTLIKKLKEDSLKGNIAIYSKKGLYVDLESRAYFNEKDRLNVDYWKLGDNYEDEYTVTVSESAMQEVYRKFHVNYGDKPNLLLAVYNRFFGRDAFSNFKKFLESNMIPFENKVYHN